MRLVIALIALLVSPFPVVAQTRPVTVDDVLDLKAVGTAFNGGAPVISPDGSAVLFTVRGWRDRTERGAVRKDARTARVEACRRGRPTAATSASCRPAVRRATRSRRPGYG